MENSSDHVKICHIVFYKTIQVSEKFIRTALQKAVAGVVQCDGRGKHAPKNKCSIDTLNLITKHLDQFPKVESHY